jgi:putative heme-binding domain-containing protein
MWAFLVWALQASNPHATPADIAEGREVYRLLCTDCHGAEGEGGRGPNLRDGVFYHGGADSDLYTTIQYGITGTEMSGFEFSELRVWQVVAFVRSLNLAADPSDLPGDPDRGEKLFRGKGDCLSCHRLGREGNFIAPDLSTVGSRRSLQYLKDSILDPSRDVRPRYWIANLTIASGGQTSGFLLDQDRHTLQILDFQGKLRSFERASLASVDVSRDSLMQSFEGVFDSKELDDIVSYLATLRPGAGR